MQRLLVTLAFGVFGAFLFVPCGGSYSFNYGWKNGNSPVSVGVWNGRFQPPNQWNSSYSPPNQWNSSYHGPNQRNSSYSPPNQWNSSYHGPNQRNSSYHGPSRYWTAGRYPRSPQFWGSPAGNASHNYFWGYKSPYDSLLYYSRVKKEKSYFRKVTLDVDFPAKHQRPNGTISCIQILDQKAIGKGGSASILRGGVGYKNVTLHFKSQRSHGFDFIVKIYRR